MPPPTHAIRKFYHRKKLLQVYALRSGKDPEAKRKRAFSTVFLSLIFWAILLAFAKVTDLPGAVASALVFGALVGASELSHYQWLEKYHDTNASDFLILRGLTLTELRALEDTIRIPNETKALPGIGAVWLLIGRRARGFIRVGANYAPATLYVLWKLVTSFPA